MGTVRGVVGSQLGQQVFEIGSQVRQADRQEVPLQSRAAAVTAANEPIKSQQIMLHVRHDFTRVGSSARGRQWGRSGRQPLPNTHR